MNALQLVNECIAACAVVVVVVAVAVAVAVVVVFFLKQWRKY